MIERFLEVIFKTSGKRSKRSYWFGQGREVATIISERDPDLVELRFQRKIVPGDIENGAVKNLAVEELVRRGGKRLVKISISYEAAVALQLLLKSSIKEMQKAQLKRKVRSIFFGIEQGLAQIDLSDDRVH